MFCLALKRDFLILRTRGVSKVLFIFVEKRNSRRGIKTRVSFSSKIFRHQEDIEGDKAAANFTNIKTRRVGRKSWNVTSF